VDLNPKAEIGPTALKEIVQDRGQVLYSAKGGKKIMISKEGCLRKEIR
jgi:hypothetical protein